MSDLAVTLTVEQLQAKCWKLSEARLRALLLSWVAMVRDHAAIDHELLELAAREFRFGDTKLVYIAQAGDHPSVKIGMSRNPAQRIVAIQIHNPLPVRCLALLPGGAPLEAMLHYQLRILRNHGEWFHLDGTILSLCQLAARALTEEA
jgi:hypothetical protein